MSYELHSIEDLKAACYNPRTITEDAASGLRVSLQSYGDISGIVFNKRTGNLVCGHQRVEQLRAIGAELIGEALVVPGTKESFFVRVVDWDDSTERAANVVANNPAIMGTFTDDVVQMLEHIKIDVGETNFGSLQLDSLFQTLDTTTELQLNPTVPTKGTQTASEEELSQVRMVQLFLNGETFEEFHSIINRLMGTLKTDNTTDTVMGALRAACGNQPGMVPSVPRTDSVIV